ncbi:hypothetical protein [Methylomicrobium sp. Wu6]|uniref:hypothetical protein n=1 Tax=Methylomicrobium sp. Wu6 TaxID=3107928 RepID=UPI002DD6A2C4|nr:hypothetical protein [Methylomicrobium sp. Wu6]MEC4749021.1 hypothetical protein [Methylomicrobium sp. Wu6]
MAEKESLKEKILAWREERQNGQRIWSFFHHLSLFGSIICSVSAGAVLQMTHNQTLASLLTTGAAVLTGIALSGGFERKWRSNRLSRSIADRMLVDIDSDNPNIDDIRKQYKLAIEKHDTEVVSDTNNDHQNGRER